MISSLSEKRRPAPRQHPDQGLLCKREHPYGPDPPATRLVEQRDLAHSPQLKREKRLDKGIVFTKEMSQQIYQFCFRSSRFKEDIATIDVGLYPIQPDRLSSSLSSAIMTLFFPPTLIPLRGERSVSS